MRNRILRRSAMGQAASGRVDLAGRPQKALDNLERLLQVPWYVSRAWLKIDPNFDPLRKNPRFQKLVARAK